MATEQKLLNRLLGGTTDNTESNGIFSVSNDAIVTTSYADDYLVAGVGFEIHRRFDATTSTKKFVLDTSGISSGLIFTLPITGVCSEGQVFMDTYKITSYTGGTAIPSINPNTISTNTALSVFKEGITSTDTAGDDLRQYIFGTQSQGAFTGGGAGSGTHAKIFNAGDLICLEILASTADVLFELNWMWYELIEE